MSSLRQGYVIRASSLIQNNKRSFHWAPLIENYGFERLVHSFRNNTSFFKENNGPTYVDTKFNSLKFIQNYLRVLCLSCSRQYYNAFKPGCHKCRICPANGISN